MKMVTCAYPPDWSFSETLALPIFLDQIPLRGVAGRIDFRLGGLISGLLLEELLERNEDWLLINSARRIAPELFLIPAGQSQELNLEKVFQWMRRACDKLKGALVKECALGIGDLYRREFGMREFSQAIIQAVNSSELEVVKLYVEFELAEKLAKEINRWLFHSSIEKPVELKVVLVPEFLMEKPL